MHGEFIVFVIPGRASSREPGIQAAVRLRHDRLDSGFTAEPVIGPARGRTRWRRPGMPRR